ncbi:MAG: ATP-dependent RNA helicase HrpA, partial [Halieaceae bacterium]|nr:ATP-dependent RNA helicase HrpA [Halieaceae bacterium]
IDVERFSRHFNDAPVIEVSGRTYPVDLHYIGDVEDRDEGVQSQIADLVQAIDAGEFGPRGDVLVFLPGEREIREIAHRLRGSDRFRVLPLYARLSQGEQQKVFTPGGAGMRVVLATNVAETSLTVPGIRYVIDPGEARISRYSHRTRLQRLPIEPISQASANQRMGRCGRVAEGVCLRLYSEQDFLGRPEFTDPEILRTNLAAVILRMLELGLGDVGRFPFIDPPEPKMIRDGYRLLEELGAVSKRGKLTSVGRKMARLPVDPKLARMLLAADEAHVLSEVLVIVSALAVQDPRERPADKRAQADQSHARFNHPRSDFMSWLSLWRYYEAQRQALSQNQLRKLCKREYLSYLRLREWRDIHGQLVIASRQLGMKPRAELPEEEHYEGIHKALLSGLLGNIAQWDEGKTFNGARNRKLQVFPGSGQYKKPPKWLVASEIVETSQVFARQCAAIEPEWLLSINPYLLKRHHHSPAWQMRSGRVMATERVTLFGLTISDGKRVDFGDVDPQAARELFIREALVPGQYHKPPVFLKHNLKLIRSVEELESRVRRRDLLVDEDVLFQFYDERLADDVSSAARLDKWLRQTPEADAMLRLERSQVLTRDPGGAVEAQFPKTLRHGDIEFRLSYQFEPGNEADGVSVTVPLPLLNRTPRHRFEWLVPGLLREKCIALIRGLPKPLRKQLVPVPDVVDGLLADMVPEDTPLTRAMSESLQRQRRVQVAESDWSAEALEDFYRMNIRLVDERGKLLAQGRDMAALVETFRDQAPVQEISVKDSPAKQDVKQWDFGELPVEWRARAAGMTVVSYPALRVEGDRLDVVLCDYLSEAKLWHPRGVAALAMKQSAQTVKTLRKQLFADNRAKLALAGAGLDRSALVNAIIEAAYAQVCGNREPRDEAGFKKALANTRSRWVPAANELAQQLVTAVEALSAARTALAGYPAERFSDSRDDIAAQIDGLFADGVIAQAPAEWLQQYPRYAKAIRHRAERLNGQYGKDQEAMARLQPQLTRLAEAKSRYPGLVALSAEASTFRWMLEEFRVSLFAQQLGTRLSVSVKRLDQQWQAVEQWMTDHPR